MLSVRLRAPLLVALVAVVSGCSGSKPNPTNGSTATTAGPVDLGPGSADTGPKGPSAPDFTLPSLDGSNVSLSDYTGKSVVLINFWSTTCDPCMVEMPHLVALYNKHKDKGFVVLAITQDGPESRAQVNSVVHDKGMTFPVLLDEETVVVARYNPKKDLPFTVLIDRSGSIVYKASAYNPGDEVKLAAQVDKLVQ